MAIDFMVMPFSRYLSGDYITPAMHIAWESGKRYTTITPSGAIEHPPNIPIGGEDAPRKRAATIEMLLADLNALPHRIPQHLWDEGSDAEPTFQRVEPKSFAALMQEAPLREVVRRSYLGMRKRTEVIPPHLHSMAFLPVPFESPFEMAAPMKCMAGSSFTARDELLAREWSPEAASAKASLLDALNDSIRLKLPMIVDM